MGDVSLDTWTTTCECCHEQTALFFCAVDSCFLCSQCDSAVHSNKIAARHHRVTYTACPVWAYREAKSKGRVRESNATTAPGLVNMQLDIFDGFVPPDHSLAIPETGPLSFGSAPTAVLGLAESPSDVTALSSGGPASGFPTHRLSSPGQVSAFPSLPSQGLPECHSMQQQLGNPMGLLPQNNSFNSSYMLSDRQNKQLDSSQLMPSMDEFQQLAGLLDTNKPFPLQQLDENWELPRPTGSVNMRHLQQVAQRQHSGLGGMQGPGSLEANSLESSSFSQNGTLLSAAGEQHQRTPSINQMLPMDVGSRGPVMPPSGAGLQGGLRASLHSQMGNMYPGQVLHLGAQMNSGPAPSRTAPIDIAGIKRSTSTTAMAAHDVVMSDPGFIGLQRASASNDNDWSLQRSLHQAPTPDEPCPSSMPSAFGSASLHKAASDTMGIPPGRPSLDLSRSMSSMEHTKMHDVMMGSAPPASQLAQSLVLGGGSMDEGMLRSAASVQMGDILRSFLGPVMTPHTRARPVEAQLITRIERPDGTFREVDPERAAQLYRYRHKRMLRLKAYAEGQKKIRYECRKVLADQRPRVKGRFAKVHSSDNLGGIESSTARALTTTDAAGLNSSKNGSALKRSCTMDLSDPTNPLRSSVMAAAVAAAKAVAGDAGSPSATEAINQLRRAMSCMEFLGGPSDGKAAQKPQFGSMDQTTHFMPGAPPTITEHDLMALGIHELTSRQTGQAASERSEESAESRSAQEGVGGTSKLSHLAQQQQVNQPENGGVSGMQGNTFGQAQVFQVSEQSQLPTAHTAPLFGNPAAHHLLDAILQDRYSPGLRM